MFTSTLRRTRPWYGVHPFTHLGFLLLLTLSLLTVSLATQSDRDAHLLELSKPVGRELAGGQSHSYRIVLTTGQYLRVVANQRGIDVVVTLFGPDGKEIVEVDSPNGTQGSEPISAITETSGTYQVTVRSLEKDAPVGRYEVKIEELRAATEQDKDHIAAERAFMQAELLRAQGSAESLRGAIKQYEEALRLCRAAGDRSRETVVLRNLSSVHHLLGESQKALVYNSQALAFLREAGDRDGEAIALNNIGTIYSSLGQKQKALDYFTQALKLVRAGGNRNGEAITLSNIGTIYDSFGEKRKALDYYTQALPLLHEAGDRNAEAATLHNMGLAYSSLGDQQKAIHHYEQALTIRRAIEDRRGETLTLIDLGFVHAFLGERQKGLDYYTEALSLARAVGDPRAQGLALHFIGLGYESLGEKRKALDYYAQALTLRHATEDLGGEAITLQNMGVLYDSLGEHQKALDHLMQALPLMRAVGDRTGEAITLQNLGAVYGDLGETKKELEYLARVLPLVRAIGAPDTEAGTLHNLMYAYQRLNNPRAASFYGKQAVGVYQQIRSNIRNLDANVQKAYLRSVELTYRSLAELLIKQGRVAEAQQLLNAFKDQQYMDFDQTQVGKLAQFTLTPRENEYAGRFKRAIQPVGSIGANVAEFRRRIGSRQPTDEEATQLQGLEAQLAAASGEFSDLLGHAETEFSQRADEKDRIIEVSDTTQMQAVLRQLKKDTGQVAVAVYTLVGEAKLYALIVTADDITSVSSAISGDELNKKARVLWGLLQSDAYDPTTLSNELYGVVFKPIEGKLPKDTKTILWSLDGSLRYVPMSALYDGKRYLVERYNHVNFTRADGERMTRAVTRNWTATGLGTSAAHTVELLGNKIMFGGLPGVTEELRRLVKQKDNQHGILEGEALQDAQFTRAAMISALRRKRPVVHIASHFAFRPGDEERSFLLIGDGTAFTLAEMKQQERLFDGVELLTLSACNTAAQLAGADGREVDAFAELAQRLGANAVMATLWRVADSSTPWLMREFYRTRRDQTLNKAEALRRAQLALLQGRAEAGPSPTTRRGAARVQVLSDANQTGDNTRAEVVFVEANNAVPFKRDPGKPFAHPYYWSPFILIGNWR